MKKEPTKIKCNLNICGNAKANAIAQSDLEVPDPDLDKATAIIKEALETDDDDDEARASR